MVKVAVNIDEHRLSLSNLSKVMYPATGFTKAQVIDYYRRMADTLLPYLEGRPLTLKRYPNGVEGEFFYEKRCPSHRPDWVEIAKMWSDRSQGLMAYCVVDSTASLVWVANLASLELHTLLSRRENLTRPTDMVFDLDPGLPADVLDCIPVALRLRDVLKKAKLESFIKTSGGKGLHLWVPLNTPVSFEQTKDFAREIAQLMERHDPQHVTSNMRKDLRKGKIFIDWSQNDDYKTTVCVYSLRAREHPTVSTPVTWKELEAAGRKQDRSALVFESAQALQRVEKLGDLFAPVLTMQQRLPSLRAG